MTDVKISEIRSTVAAPSQERFHRQASTFGQYVQHKRVFKSSFEIFVDRVRQRIDNRKLVNMRARLTRNGVHASDHIIRSRLSATEQDEFIDSAYSVFESLQAGDRSRLDEMLGSRHTILIIGAARTGGSFLNKNLVKMLMPSALSDPVPRFESMPRTSWLRQSHMKRFRDQALFEFVQWALWVKRFHDVPMVVKKCSGLMYDMSLTGQIFQPEQVSYLITVRHPARILVSALDAAKRHRFGHVPWEGALENGDAFYQGREVPAWWKEASALVRSLHVWCELYTRVLQGLDVTHLRRIRAVGFDAGPEAIISLLDELSPELLAQARQVLSANQFESESLEVDPFWSTGMAIGALKGVKESWAAKGLNLPLDPERPL